MEADMQCTNAIQNMDRKLRAACHSADAKLEQVLKEEEVRDKTAKIEHVEKRLATLILELKAADSKIESYNLEIAGLKSDIKELRKLEAANSTAQSYEREAKILEQEQNHLEQKYRSEFLGFDEVQERYKAAGKEVKRATEMAEKARPVAATAHKEE